MGRTGDIRIPSWLTALAPGIELLGAPTLLVERPIAVLGSRRCPGALLLAATDWADAWASGGDQRPVLAGGFQTPVEAEVLRRVLRGQARAVLLPARGLPRRLAPAERPAFDAARLAYASPFKAAHPSAALAARRNALLARIVRAAIILHAAPGSQTLAWAADAAAKGIPLYTLDHPANEPLLALGGRPLTHLD